MITHTQNLSGDRTIRQFTGKASNIYIIEDKRQKAAVLVDCGMWSDKKSLVEVLRRLPPLKRVVCTHFHVDHVSGWTYLKAIFKDGTGPIRVVTIAHLEFVPFTDIILRSRIVKCCRPGDRLP